MINLILFGPPGSGKGTQAKTIVSKFGLTHISTGDLFRYEMGNNTPLGIKAKKFIDAGDLVPDEVTIGMLENKLDSSNNEKGYIFDGFPRTLDQARALDEMLQRKGNGVTHLIALDVDKDELVKRLLDRGKTSGRSDDQNEDTIINRYNTYLAETSPVYNFYEEQQKSKKVNGIGELHDIFNRIYDVLTA